MDNGLLPAGDLILLSVEVAVLILIVMDNGLLRSLLRLRIAIAPSS